MVISLTMVNPPVESEQFMTTSLVRPDREIPCIRAGVRDNNATRLRSVNGCGRGRDTCLASGCNVRRWVPRASVDYALRRGRMGLVLEV
jgi:hypothetical protein